MDGVWGLGGAGGFTTGIFAGGVTRGLGFVDPLILGCLCGWETTFAAGGLRTTEVDVGVAIDSLIDADGETFSVGLVGGGLGCEVGGVGRVQGEDGMIGGLSFGTGDLGGHSRFSLTSSIAESPVVCDATLELRGEAPINDWRLFCCSKRPIRLATL